VKLRSGIKKQFFASGRVMEDGRREKDTEMKKPLCAIFLAAGIMLVLAACGNEAGTGPVVTEADNKDTVNIVTEESPAAEETEAPSEASVVETETKVAEETTEQNESSRVYTPEEYAAAGVNELNSVPILMYHRIYDMTNDETEYTGGNVDKDGYNRTYEAFENDLEMYYDSGYRCMRLTDYLDGEIDVPFGYSPIILTFDDGRQEAGIEGFDAEGNPIFAPHSALGILEAFKEKHPDFRTTATFFLNEALFEEIPAYEDRVKVVQWLVDHGYDVGNHTLDHPQLSDCTAEEITRQVGGMYRILEDTIPGKYVNIVALPYGDPTDMKADAKYENIMHGEYEGFPYETKGALLCGCTRQCSPFTTDWDPTHIRRIRGYDNHGEEFDIEMCFAQLNEGKRYISDGNPDTVVIRAEEEEGWLGDTGGREVIRY